MLLRFGDYELDTAGAELRGPAGPVPMEPKALALLTLLAGNAGRVVGREEMIEVVWHGRIVSDGAVATVLKLVRKALGDDGVAQRYLRTVQGVGHRLVPPVAIVAGAPGAAAPAIDGRPTVAVLPFRALGGHDVWKAVGEALPAEVIASLSRLRWLRVIARESAFRFGAGDVDLGAARSVLGAGYALTGAIEAAGGRLWVTVELAETAGGRVLWADRLDGAMDAVHEVRAAIVAAVVTALELQIPVNEAAAARLRPVERLDAWDAFHLGLAHLYRFNRRDNEIAAGWFRRSTELDPGFATAFAMLAFTGFQEVMMGYAPDRDAAVRDMLAAAERGYELDPLDPYTNFSMGRAPMVLGRPEDGHPLLDRAVRIAPSFAKGYYSRGYVGMLSGRQQTALADLDRALVLSPLDPLVGPMHFIRGLALAFGGRIEEAAEASALGARQAGSHIVGLWTTAALQALAGNAVQARLWAGRARQVRTDFTLAQMRQSLPVGETALTGAMFETLRGLGLSE
jgi:TolB-like protein